MGYLDKATITVDAILTNRGRELLAQGGVGENQAFDIKKFAVADDEVDYGLYNVQHPNGTQFWGSVIENMPVLEATPDEQQIMRYKLVTLESVDGAIDSSGRINIPFIEDVDDLTLTPSKTSEDKTFKTSIRVNANTTPISEKYVLLVADARLVNISTLGTTVALNTMDRINANGSITIDDINTTLVFSRKEGITGTTTATVFGIESGATATFTITVS
jgi:hypothetical protein